MGTLQKAYLGWPFKSSRVSLNLSSWRPLSEVLNSVLYITARRGLLRRAFRHADVWTIGIFQT